MLLRSLRSFNRVILGSQSHKCIIYSNPYSSHNSDIENKYSIDEKERILGVLNKHSLEEFSRYDIAKTRLKKFVDWKKKNNTLTTLSQFSQIDGLTEKTAVKLFDSILSGGNEANGKIRGTIIQPHLSENIRQSCKSVLALYITANSVSWTLIDRPGYEVVRWHYHNLDNREDKKMQITDLMEASWRVYSQLPTADLVVMRAEMTSLRAAGSDPNNPKVIVVNLQRAQMVAMIVALVNAAGLIDTKNTDELENKGMNQKVYFLKPYLPYRLYGTLVGNEQISTEQTVEVILQETKAERSKDGSHVFMSEQLKAIFRAGGDLEKDMLGHCLLLGLTFMDLCIYKNKDRLNKLLGS